MSGNYQFANVELDKKTLQKTIAYLVVKNSDMKKKLEKIEKYIKKHYYEILYGEFLVSADDILKILHEKTDLVEKIDE